MSLSQPLQQQEEAMRYTQTADRSPSRGSSPDVVDGAGCFCCSCVRKLLSLFSRPEYEPPR